jgi:hypothetical protein
MEIRKGHAWRGRPLAVGVVGVTLAGGIALGAVGVSHRHPHSAPPPPVLSTTTVVRTDLTTTATYTATVGFDALQTVSGEGSGIITHLPAAGSVIKRGQPLYWVNEQPVVVFYGTTPLFRTLQVPHPNAAQASLQSAQAALLAAQQALSTAEKQKPVNPVTVAQDSAAVAQAQNTVNTGQTALNQASTPLTGQDVAMVAANLAALGDLPVSEADTSTWTEALSQAVRDFQRSAGMADTGTLAPGQVVVVPGPSRVGAVTAHVGDPASSPVLSLTGTTELITFTGKGDLHAGQPITVSTATGAQLSGRIVTVAPAGSSLQVRAKADNPGTMPASGSLSVTVITASRPGVLAVPVEALLALANGGYALQTPAGLLLPVSIGLISNDQVEVSGAGVDVGLRVVTAA